MLRIGVSTGLYTIARAEELATAVKKVGYALTRGVAMIELAADVPHEVTKTEGREIRHIAKKQGLTLGLHGSLTVPMDLPERSDWRDADVHLKSSVVSAVFCGAKYVNFHSCLNYWLELLTYAGRKLTSAFVDHEGRFISAILKENERLRDWFVEHKWRIYDDQILDEKENLDISNEIAFFRRSKEDEMEDKQRRLREMLRMGQATEGEVKEVEEELNSMRANFITESTKFQTDAIKKKLRDKLSKGKPWRLEELRAEFGTIDGYMIMAHHMFFSRDPIWVAMLEQYPNVAKKHSIDYSDSMWLETAWKKAEQENDREFKEFFYGVVCAKYIEGHMKRLFEWMKKELPPLIQGKDDTETQELAKIAKELKITVESPDARDPSHAGLFMLWHPKAIYAAVKAIRKSLETDRLWMLIDFEHIATQGVDCNGILKEVTEKNKDFGALTLAAHSNRPNPLHAHYPVELGDTELYELQYMLRITGMGKAGEAYVIFERGGGEDPFKHAVDALRLMVQCLEKDIAPDKLPLEFFGIKGPTAGDFMRQMQIVQEHKEEPLKDLLEMPEEDWTALSQATMKRGKRPEQWSKAQYR